MTDPFGVDNVSEDLKQSKPEPVPKDNQNNPDGEYLDNLIDKDEAGLESYKKALALISLNQYVEAENELKKTLKGIKDDKQDSSFLYLHILSRLAHVNFLTKKIPEAEKYYLICKDMSQKIPDVEDNGFIFYNYLLDFYLHTDLTKAKKLSDEMLDIEFQSINVKRLKFSIANYHLFSKDYDKAMESYQKVLKLIPDENLKAFTLNNMAITGIQKHKREGLDSDDQKSIVSTFKEAIELLENLPANKAKSPKSGNNESMLSEIFDSHSIIPEDYSHETSQDYVGLLTNPDSGKIITNLSEFLLMHEKENPVNIAFWFKMGLDLHQNHAPTSIDRHLVLMALFYSADGQESIANDLFQQSLKKMKNQSTYTRAMGLNMYGRLLYKNPKLKERGTAYLQKSEQLMTDLPHWYDTIESAFLLRDIQ
jgi:tetratricopeptide (TPR) repeat protein